MNLNVYSYHGFGDHCIVYGIIKEYAKRYDNLFYYTDVVSERDLYTRKRLYAGIKNVEIMDVPFTDEVYKTGYSFLGLAQRTPWFDAVRPWIENPYLPAPEWFTEDWQFDKMYYSQADIPFNLKWDNFDFKRDLKIEKEVYYDVLGLKDDEEFIFIHEDHKRDYVIDRKYINQSIKLIEFSKLQNINILDILYTIEKSKEFHVFNSGLLEFVDQMNIQHDSLNYHKYVRPMPFEQPVLKLNWKIHE